MSHAADPDELFEVASDELRSVAPWERLEYSEGGWGCGWLAEGSVATGS